MSEKEPENQNSKLVFHRYQLKTLLTRYESSELGASIVQMVIPEWCLPAFWLCLQSLCKAHHTVRLVYKLKVRSIVSYEKSRESREVVPKMS